MREPCVEVWRHKGSGREYCAQRSHAPIRRDAEKVRIVMAMRAAGASWAAIGRRLGLSPQRVAQIYDREVSS